MARLHNKIGIEGGECSVLSNGITEQRDSPGESPGASPQINRRNLMWRMFSERYKCCPIWCRACDVHIQKVATSVHPYLSTCDTINACTPLGVDTASSPHTLGFYVSAFAVRHLCGLWCKDNALSSVEEVLLLEVRLVGELFRGVFIG